MVKFDTILNEINGFGKYQKFSYALICLSGLLPPLVVYLHNFIAPNLKHRCTHANIINDSFNSEFLNYTQEQILLEKCTITDFSNDTKVESKCDKWVFDKTYYQTTLTEEVSVI